MVSAAAVLVVFTAVPAAFGLVHFSRARPHRPIGVPAASTVTTIPGVGPAIVFPDSLGGLRRNANAPLPQILVSDGLAMAGTWYGGSTREPALELSVHRYPKGDDSGQAIIDRSVRLGHFQSFWYDGVAFHCNRDRSIRLLGQCIFYDPESRMLVILQSHTPAWSNLRRLSELANQARRCIDRA